MRKATFFFGMVLVSFVAANTALALDGNTRKGKFLYRKNCRSCHGASASDLSPSSKPQAEWLQIHGAQATLPCHKDWASLSDQDKNDIFAYLHAFASDSPTPAKCE
jgi:hypothetical protein